MSIVVIWTNKKIIKNNKPFFKNKTPLFLVGGGEMQKYKSAPQFTYIIA
jgi:hypothetical protein